LTKEVEYDIDKYWIISPAFIVNKMQTGKEKMDNK